MVALMIQFLCNFFFCFQRKKKEMLMQMCVLVGKLCTCNAFCNASSSRNIARFHIIADHSQKKNRMENFYWIFVSLLWLGNGTSLKKIKFVSVSLSPAFIYLMWLMLLPFIVAAVKVIYTFYLPLFGPEVVLKYYVFCWFLYAD